jgi:hypothetical protein
VHSDPRCDRRRHKGMPGGGCGHLDPRPAAARELEAVIARRDAPDLIVSDHGSGADHLSPRDLAAPAMAIGSNPLRSTRKSARAAVGSVFRELFEVLMGQRGLQHRPCLDEPAPNSGFTESIAGDPYTEELIGPTSGI